MFKKNKWWIIALGLIAFYHNNTYAMHELYYPRDIYFNPNLPKFDCDYKMIKQIWFSESTSNRSIFVKFADDKTFQIFGDGEIEASMIAYLGHIPLKVISSNCKSSSVEEAYEIFLEATKISSKD